MGISDKFFITLCFLAKCSLVDYRFASNIGQVFYDHSGNNNHAVNGDSSLDTLNDVSYSDRGIYFATENKRETLPSNNLVANSIVLNSPFSIIIWLYIVERTNEVLIFSRYKEDDFGMRITLYTLENGYISCMCNLNNLCKELHNFYNITSKWEIIVYSVNNKDISLSVTNKIPIEEILENDYSENNIKFLNLLGFKSSNSHISTKFFVYRFTIENSIINIQDLYSSSVPSFTCVSPPCPLTCQTAFKELSEYYCLPLQNNQSSSSNGSPCSCASGCSNDLSCLSPLDCKFNSTYFKGSSMYCICGSSGTSSSCSEPFCFEGCSSCKDYYTCLTCRDPFSVLFQSIECKCQDGYFNSTAVLGTTFSCQPCFSQCKTCSDFYSCLTCKDKNAFVDFWSNCKCLQGFFNYSGICVACENGCEKCEGPGICLDCGNGFLLKDGRCVCLEGFYNFTQPVDVSRCQECMDSSCPECSEKYQCLRCPEECETCTNSVNCSKCKPDFSEITSDQTKICVKCLPGCKQCDISGHCIECKSDAYILENHKCLCKPGHWNNSSLTSQISCIKCNDSCLTCNNSTSCDSCLDNNAEPSKMCKCVKGYFLLKEKCNKCDSSCKSCENSENCLECFETFTLVKGLCTCFLPKTIKNNQCVRIYFSASLEVETPNFITLNFENQLKTNLKLTDFFLSIPKLKQYKIVYLTKKHEKNFNFKIIFQENIRKGTQATLNIKKPLVYSKDNETLSFYSFDFFLPEYNIDSEVDSKLLSKIKSVIFGVASASFFVSLITNPSSFWIFLSTLQIIKLIPLSTFKKTLKIRKICSSIGSFEILPNFFSFFIDPKSSSKPFRVVEEIESSDFFLNFGVHLTFLILGVVMMPFVYCLSIVKVSFLSKRFSEYWKSYRFSFFLRFLIQSYLDLGVSGIIQVYSVRFKQEPRNELIGFYFSYIFAVFSVVRIKKGLFICAPVITALVILRNKENIKNVPDSRFCRDFRTLFEEFDNRGSFGLFFYAIFLLRRFVFVFCQIFLDENHFSQFLVHIICSLLWFVYCLCFCSFKLKTAQIVLVLSEVVVFFTFLTTFIVIFVDDEFWLNFLAYFIVSIVFAFICVEVFIEMMKMFWKVKGLKDKFLLAKEKKRERPKFNNLFSES